MLATIPPIQLSTNTTGSDHTKVAGMMSTAPGRLNGWAATNDRT